MLGRPVDNHSLAACSSSFCSFCFSLCFFCLLERMVEIAHTHHAKGRVALCCFRRCLCAIVDGLFYHLCQRHSSYFVRHVDDRMSSERLINCHMLLSHLEFENFPGHLRPWSVLGGLEAPLLVLPGSSSVHYVYRQVELSMPVRLRASFRASCYHYHCFMSYTDIIRLYYLHVINA